MIIKYAFILCFIFHIAVTQSEMENARCSCSGVSATCEHVTRGEDAIEVLASDEDQVFSITDRDPTTWLGDNKPRYDPESQTIRYTVIPQDTSIFYWSMPAIFKGDLQHPRINLIMLVNKEIN